MVTKRRRAFGALFISLAVIAAVVLDLFRPMSFSEFYGDQPEVIALGYFHYPVANGATDPEVYDFFLSPMRSAEEEKLFSILDSVRFHRTPITRMGPGEWQIRGDFLVQVWVMDGAGELITIKITNGGQLRIEDPAYDIGFLSSGPEQELVYLITGSFHWVHADSQMRPGQ